MRPQETERVPICVPQRMSVCGASRCFLMSAIFVAFGMTSSSYVKFTGDFGNAIEVIRIADCFTFRIFRKSPRPFNFRLLQHNHNRHDSSRRNRSKVTPKRTTAIGQVATPLDLDYWPRLVTSRCQLFWTDISDIFNRIDRSRTPPLFCSDAQACSRC